MSKKTDDARERYIQLLAEVGGDLSDVPLTAELIKEGYLEGVVRTDTNGQPNGTAVLGITLKGRLFLRTLKEEKKKESAWSRFSRAAIVVGAFIAGLFTDILKEWLKALLS